MDDIEETNLEIVNRQSDKDFFELLENKPKKIDDRNESYNFTRAERPRNIIEADMLINKTLRPDARTSKYIDNTKNMSIIVGDVLDAFKSFHGLLLNTKAEGI